ncbi:hypothetical protein FMEAI12_6320003 [Parafrankia sp. Ea1.12]|nr:hypothetical protein FMEAI12_6320003 [Parafrankia sp. Ea1.12]
MRQNLPVGPRGRCAGVIRLPPARAVECQPHLWRDHVKGVWPQPDGAQRGKSDIRRPHRRYGLTATPVLTQPCT